MESWLTTIMELYPLCSVILSNRRSKKELGLIKIFKFKKKDGVASINKEH
jgi:hypothetical protein